MIAGVVGARFGVTGTVFGSTNAGRPPMGSGASIATVETLTSLSVTVPSFGGPLALDRAVRYAAPKPPHPIATTAAKARILKTFGRRSAIRGSVRKEDRLSTIRHGLSRRLLQLASRKGERHR